MILDLTSLDSQNWLPGVKRGPGILLFFLIPYHTTINGHLTTFGLFYLMSCVLYLQRLEAG